MNILFVTNRNVFPLIGGIERITYSVAEALRNIYGMRCYSLYTQENKLGETTTDVFAGKECLEEKNQVEQIAAYIKRNEINVVIAQGSDARVNVLMPQLREAVDMCIGVKLLFAFHTMPSFELVPMNKSVLWKRMISGDNKAAACKQVVVQLLTMIFPTLAIRLVSKKYRIPYQMADKVIVLSNKYIPLYNQFVHGREDKYAVIHNTLSFREEELTNSPKQKAVLVVARMEERAKRITKALEVWKNAYQPDWHFYLVGDGEDKLFYQKLTDKWHLQNVHFEGAQNSLSYYERSSIFLLTSAFEGWPMTLMETQQCGCVPIAFDSFGAIHDIIDSGRNGIIVPEGDVDEYAAQLKQLMNNPDELKRLSDNARKDCMRFSHENIAKQWKTLLESL